MWKEQPKKSEKGKKKKKNNPGCTPLLSNTCFILTTDVLRQAQDEESDNFSAGTFGDHLVHCHLNKLQPREI